MQVRWTSPAAQDLEEIALYIQRDRRESARTVATTLFEAANSLEFMPSRGRAGRIMGTRELVIPGLPYIIVYEVTDTAVQIHHIYHAARDWPGER
jgi:addiction module RelE/StbE family toxin